MSNDRIYGSECEYGIYVLKNDRWESPEAFTKYAGVPSFSSRSNNSKSFHLFNGGAVFRESVAEMNRYVPEYNTPECRSVLDLVTWEKAGDRIFSDIYSVDTPKQAVDIYKHGRSIAYRTIGERQVFSDDSSTGRHENYSVRVNGDNFARYFLTQGPEMRVSRLLMTFLASRCILNGSGWVNADLRSPLPYEISYRADLIVSDIGSVSTRSRPLILDRPEHLTSVDQPLGRLQIIMGDHNMSECSTLLTFGTLGLVLRLIERGKWSGLPILNNPVSALHHFSSDALLRHRAEVSGGSGASALSALEIQTLFHGRVREMLVQDGATSEEEFIAAYWGEVLEKLKTDIYALEYELDWVTKLRLIEKYLKKRKLSWDDVKAKRIMRGGDGHDTPLQNLCADIDLLYHSLRERGLYNQLQKRGLYRRMVTDAAIEHATLHAPVNTRAAIRSDFLRTMDLCHMYGYADNWQLLKYYPRGDVIYPGSTAQHLIQIEISNPFDNRSQEWEDLKNSILGG